MLVTDSISTSASAPYTTLISANQLQALQASTAPLLIFDVSYDLMQPAAGAEQYASGHLPGAIFADLHQDLSAHGDPGSAASGGRHPLPNRATFADWLAQSGLSQDSQVVVYDRQNANYCVRLWWMLKWVGHEAVAVLDGGLPAWQAAGGTLDRAAPEPTAGNFELAAARAELVDAEQVLARLGQAGQTVIDARASARYRGEVEPIDPVAGHIPGALNRPFSLNFDADGRFKPAAVLRAEFEELLAGHDPAEVVHQCGSGVSATPNVLAMELAGLGRSKLYAGSWSDWCSDPSRPVAQG
jgi:thiosulfate/3-mercaptopyruvate sulfurtransferase